jgi:predicted TIM-barrel fold metal-dependent hydrolase
MKKGIHIFDTHTHVGVAQHSGRRYTADQLLADMDRFGVDRSLVIPFPMVEDYRAAHDEIGRAVRGHPDRLTGAACLNPFVPEPAFRGEVRRCAQEFGFGVLKFQPQYQPLNPISFRSDFYFETAIENKMALVCHTGTGIPFALPSAFMIPARNFPQLKFVLAHCGGGGILLGDAIVAAVFCPNIYLELSTLMPYHVLEVIAHVPASRLMIGSDLPESLETEIGKILGLKIAEEARRDILWNTACGVFGQSR